MPELTAAPFEGAFEGCPEPLAIVENGALIAINAAFRETFGASADLSAVIHPDDRNILDASLGAPSKSAFVARRAGGEGAASRWTTWPIGAGKACLRLDGPAEGQTIPRALAPWFEPNERPSLATLVLGKMFERLDAVVWAIEKDGTTLLSEGAGLAHYGLKSGQMVGMNALQLYPHDTDAYKEATMAFEGQRVRVDRLEGAEYWVTSLDPVFAADGAVTALVGFGMCVTENTRATAQAKSLLEAINQLPLAVWAMDAEGVCTLSAGGGVRDIGFDPNWLVGKNLFEVFAQSPHTLSYLGRALEGEQFCSEDTFGGAHWRNHFIPIRDALGTKVVRVISVTENLTEQINTQRKLEEQLALIQSQQQAIASLTSPIIEVWQGVLVVPVIGNLSEERAQRTLEQLLEEVVGRQSHAVILDLTGVEVVDTATAQHLFDIMRAVELLGATGVVSGVRPSVARTMVDLGINLSARKTYPTLAEALRRLIGARGK